MVEIFRYNKIIKYKITAVCAEPLHIGNAGGEKGQVLVHPADGIPFVQASSIAGVFQMYYRNVFGQEEADQLFGAHNISGGIEEIENDMDSGELGGQESRIRISDGNFCLDETALKMELRPRVKINRETGTCDVSPVQGTDKDSGQKFEMEYIGAGARIQFSVYLYDMDAKEKLEDVFRAIQRQQIQLGGQKSNGCGYLKISQLLCKEFDMEQEQDRKLWIDEEKLEKSAYDDHTADILEMVATEAYRITVTGKTEGDLLVKSISVTDFGKDAPDCMNIQNAKKDYIIPGSSFKGTIRSQMEMIASYLKVGDIIDDTFGVPKYKKQKGKSGNIRFFDTKVGEQNKNNSNRVTHRIHIDKFTGGVMHQGLFSEKNVFGDVEFRIEVLNKNHPERTCGLLFLALRDMASGMVSVGGGRNVGKGFIKVEKMLVESGDGTSAQINFPDKIINDGSGIIKRCLDAIRRKEDGKSCPEN